MMIFQNRLCTNCRRATYKVHTTDVLRERGVRIRYYHCKVCGHIPPGAKQVVPLEFAPPRVGAS